MDRDTRQLAILATIFFFPTALVGLFLFKQSAVKARAWFRGSLYIFLFITMLIGATVVLEGGKMIPILGSFY